MIKADIVRRIKEHLCSKSSYYDISSVVNILIDEMAEQLIDTGEVFIPNLGKFRLKTLKGKAFINVKTGKREVHGDYNLIHLRLSRNIVNQLKSEYREKNATSKV